MSKGIQLSPKHGFNPCIPLCFWCGRQKNEIALMGKMKGDIEAPKNLVLDYEPCDHCKENWSKGVVLMELQSRPIGNNFPPIREENGTKLYPTSNILVLEVSAARALFSIPQLKEGDVLHVEVGIIAMILERAEE